MWKNIKGYILSECINIKVIGVLFLCAITMMFFNIQEQYTVNGPELLEDSVFCCGLQEWEKSSGDILVIAEKTPILQIESNSHKKVVSVSQLFHVRQKFQLLKFTGDLKTKNVESGSKPWEEARLILTRLDDNGDPIYTVPHVLVSRHGSTGWERFTRVFRLGKQEADVRITVQLLKATGVMWVRNLSVTPVAENSAYEFYRQIFVLIWAVFVLFILIDWLRTYRVTSYHIKLALIIVIIMTGALMTQDMRSSFYSAIQPVYIEYAPASWVVSEVLSPLRVAHFLMFALLTLIILSGNGNNNKKVTNLWFILLLAMTTEVLQFLVDGRNPRMLDFFSDVAGILTSLSLWVIWYIMCISVVRVRRRLYD